MPRVSVDAARLPVLRQPTPQEDHLRTIRHAFAATPWSAGGHWSPSLGPVGPAPGEWVVVSAYVEPGGILYVSAALRPKLRRVVHHVGTDAVTYTTDDGESVTVEPDRLAPIAPPESIARTNPRRQLT